MNQEPAAGVRRGKKVYWMAAAALMTAVTCVLAPLSVPIGPVPISLTNLAIYFSLYLLGWKWGAASYLVYMLIGMTGLPVFSGFTGGLGHLGVEDQVAVAAVQRRTEYLQIQDAGHQLL